MAFVRKYIDVANKQVQFEITENASSLNLKHNTSLFDAKVTVLKIQKNTQDKVLYSQTFQELSKICKFAFPKMLDVLPFAIGKTLILNDDDKLMVTIDFPEEDVPTSFEYEINTNLELTSNPLVIKNVSILDEKTFSTEFYPLVALDCSTVQSYAAILKVKDSQGNEVIRKVYLGESLLKSEVGDYGLDFKYMVTQPNQEITVKGNTDLYLILV